MRLLFGTNNKGKVIEIKEGLAGLLVEVVTPLESGITETVHETCDTFEGNALQKARFYFAKSGIPTLADDSGIIVESLKNELGIHTRRWGSGPDASDEEWINFFLNRMKHERNKRARFVCVLAFIDEHGKEHLFEGTCEGSITENLEAGYLPGLPISACFKPDGFDKVYSAMGVEQKNQVSHRGKAVEKFKSFFSINLI